jgi:hypothetical protein
LSPIRRDSRLLPPIIQYCLPLWGLCFEYLTLKVDLRSSQQCLEIHLVSAEAANSRRYAVQCECYCHSCPCRVGVAAVTYAQCHNRSWIVAWYRGLRRTLRSLVSYHGKVRRMDRVREWCVVVVQSRRTTDDSLFCAPVTTL